LNIVKIGNRSYTWEPNFSAIKKVLDYYANIEAKDNLSNDVIDALQNILDGKSFTKSELLIKDLLKAERELKIKNYGLVTIISPLEQIANEPYYFLYKNVLNRFKDLIFNNKKGEIALNSIIYLKIAIEEYYSTIQKLLPKFNSYMYYNDIVYAIFDPSELLDSENDNSTVKFEKSNIDDDTLRKKIDLICDALTWLIFIIKTLIDKSSVAVNIDDLHKELMWKIFCLRLCIMNDIKNITSPKISEQLVYADIVCFIVFFYFNFKNFHLDDIMTYSHDSNISFNITNLKNIYMEINSNIDLILSSSFTPDSNMGMAAKLMFNSQMPNMMTVMQEQCLNNAKKTTTI